MKWFLALKFGATFELYLYQYRRFIAKWACFCQYIDA